MAEFMFVSFLEEIDSNIADYPGGLPLHMTVVPPFTSDNYISPTELDAAIKTVLQNLGAFSISLEEVLLGPENNIPAVAIRRTPELEALHARTTAVVEELGGVYDKTWTGNLWLPHATNTPTKRLEIGQAILIDTVSMVAKTKKGRPKVILNEYPLH